MCNYFKKDNCLTKGAYIKENVLYYTKLSFCKKSQAQLEQNEHSESTKEEGIITIFDKL